MEYRTVRRKNSVSQLKLSLLENDDCDFIKRSICTDPDNDEYSIKATRTLYIGNLQSEISYNELRETYSAYGDIIVCSDELFRKDFSCKNYLFLNRNWKSNVKHNLNIKCHLHLFNMRI